jgi:hypothetical protein
MTVVNAGTGTGLNWPKQWHITVILRDSPTKDVLFFKTDTTMPNAVGGYAVWCIGIYTGGGSKVTLYCNEATTNTSCSFVAQRT